MNLTFIFITLGWAAFGLIAGIAVGIALQKTSAPIGSLGVFLIAIGWAFAWAIGNLIFRSPQMIEMVYQDYPYNYVWLGLIAGFIGGGITLFMIYRAHVSG